MCLAPGNISYRDNKTPFRGIIWLHITLTYRLHYKTKFERIYFIRECNLVRKVKGKRQHGICRHWWDNNIRMDCRELGWEGVSWVHLAQDRY